MKLINNIDCIRLEIKQGENIFYFPFATNFKDRFVNKIMVYSGVFRGDKNPQTGNTILYEDSFNFFLYARNKQGEQLYNGFPLNCLSLNYNLQQTEINDFLDIDNTYIKINSPYTEKNEVLIYVFYSENEVSDLPDTYQVGLNIPKGYSGGLTPFVNSLCYSGLLKIEVTDKNKENPAFVWLNLTTKEKKTFENLTGFLFARDNTKRNLGVLYFDALTLDYQQSTVQTDDDIALTLTFKK